MQSCFICNTKMDSVFTLPKLPLTGIYAEKSEANFPAFDFELIYCQKCGHAQGLSKLDVSKVYNESYSFRTSASESASGGVRFFKENLKRLFGDRKFNTIVDVGCNDGHLLKQLKDTSHELYGIDMIWKDREHEFDDDKIVMFGDKIEEIPLWEKTNGVPELIVCQHTIEHIEDPESLLKTLIDSVNSETHFLFEFPCLDLLLENLRFDQVFHQHLQYFSVNSFEALLNKLGAEVLDIQFNQHYWGAVHVLFKKSTSKLNVKSQKTPSSLINIKKRYQLFQQQMKDTANQIEWLYDKGEPIIGYGAALMLPVTFYHLAIDPMLLTCIYDDDKDKNNLTYINLPIVIKAPLNDDFSQINIVLTAIENRRPILKKLLFTNAKRIINPLNLI